MGLSRCKIIIIVIVIVIIAVALGIGLGLGLQKKSSEKKTSAAGPSLGVGPYKHAAVASDADHCSELGGKILMRGGSAVDSAVASLFCVGLLNLHSTGIGGGGFMLVYTRATKQSTFIDYREVAPSAANSTMYVNQPDKAKLGATAAGVPGEVRGLHTAWQKFGKLPWRDLVQPTLDLAKDGFKIIKALRDAMIGSSASAKIAADPGLRDLLMENGKLKAEGTVIKHPAFAATLEKIRDDPNSFYTGSLAEDIAKDIQEAGGIITTDDLKNYAVEVHNETIVNQLGDRVLHAAPPPSSGAVVTFIMNIMKGYNLGPEARANDSTSALTYHRIVEAFKFGFARRAMLADPKFENVTETFKNLISSQYADKIRHKIWDSQTHQNYTYYGESAMKSDSGTTHLSVLAPNGDAVSVTGTVNWRFGGGFLSNRTGILYNNEMDDFSTPGLVNLFGLKPSKVNFIKPGKRPMSSMSPVIFTNKDGDVELICGAAGGTKIITSTSLVSMSKLWFGKTLLEAVSAPRFHHQLFPPNITANNKEPYVLPKGIQDGLRARGHQLNLMKFLTVVQAVSREKDGSIYGVSDPRKFAQAAGY